MTHHRSSRSGHCTISKNLINISYHLLVNYLPTLSFLCLIMVTVLYLSLKYLESANLIVYLPIQCISLQKHNDANRATNQFSIKSNNNLVYNFTVCNVHLMTIELLLNIACALTCVTGRIAFNLVIIYLYHINHSLWMLIVFTHG